MAEPRDPDLLRDAVTPLGEEPHELLTGRRQKKAMAPHDHF